MDTLKTQHNGIAIEYNEKRNVWVFELRGREREADTLLKAKEVIDKPEPKDKPPFTRVKAYTERSYDGSGFQTVDVTSVAFTHSWQETEYWISTKNKQRQKVTAHSLYPVTPKNDELIAQIKSIDEQSAALGKQRSALKSKLEEMPTQK